MEKHTPYTDSYFIRTRKIVQEKVMQKLPMQYLCVGL